MLGSAYQHSRLTVGSLVLGSNFFLWSFVLDPLKCVLARLQFGFKGPFHSLGYISILATLVLLSSSSLQFVVRIPSWCLNYFYYGRSTTKTQKPVLRSTLGPGMLRAGWVVGVNISYLCVCSVCTLAQLGPLHSLLGTGFISCLSVCLGVEENTVGAARRRNRS